MNPQESFGLFDTLIVFVKHGLMPAMLLTFASAVVLRVMIYYTVMREYWFAQEFEKRVDYFLETTPPRGKVSFYMITRRLLEKTFYELFEVRYYMKRRRPDFVMTWSDRIFLIKQGGARLVHDILKNVKPIRFDSARDPKLFQTSKKVLAQNPAFSRVFGLIPTATTTEMLNLLPGIFIVMGVFGTFLGIMQSLPSLNGMDISDVEGTKVVMDQFLLKISFSMSTSLLGIFLSIVTSFFNSAFSPQQVYVNAVDRLEAALDALWNISTDNEIPENLESFDENKNPEEVLAQQSLEKELIMIHQKRSRAS